MSSSIAFSGLASGLDTGAIIDALVASARQPINRLQTKRSNYDSKLSLLSDLSSKLSKLQTAAKKVDTSSEFLSYTAESTASAKIAATASGSAGPGTYEIIVDNLVQNERTYSDPFAADDQTGLVGSGTLTIQVGTSTALDIAIDDTTDDLNAVALAINDSGADVTASVVHDGTSYRLLVTGDIQGAEGAITFTETAGLNLDLDDALNQKQQAQDAQIRMDDLTITSSSNKVTGVIPGVTLDLKATTGGTAETITVKVDTETIKSNVQELITAYNDVASFLNKQFTYSGTARPNTLMGDSAARSVQTQLRNIVFGAVDDLDEPYTALARVGVKSSSDGSLTLDTTKLDEALADDLYAVADVFAYDDGITGADDDGIAVQLQSAVKLMLQDPDGLIANREDGLQDQIDDIDAQIDRLERNVDSYEETLNKQFLALEQTLASLQSQSNFLQAKL